MKFASENPLEISMDFMLVMKVRVQVYLFAFTYSWSI
jgi:hypothetical protein